MNEECNVAQLRKQKNCPVKRKQTFKILKLQCSTFVFCPTLSPR